MKMKMRRPDVASERALDELRREAERRGRVDASGVHPMGAPFPRATTETGYYGLPLLQEPTWTWEIPLYFFVGGAAGASALVGSAARWTGADGELVRHARWIAAAGGAASTPLLIADLGRPERFLNMLRVFKLKSPMSVGAWTLVAFSSSSAARLFAEAVERKMGGRFPVVFVGNAAEVLSAATGLVMSTYTGVLIGATVVPVWSRNVRLLPVEFGASALASAVSLLELAGHRERALQLLGLGAAAVESFTGFRHEIDADPALDAMRKGSAGTMLRIGALLSGPLQLAFRLLGRRRAAALAALAGSLLSRYGWVEAGKRSARDPAIPLELPSSERAKNARLEQGA